MVVGPAQIVVAYPITAATNEMGTFSRALDSLLQMIVRRIGVTLLTLFRSITQRFDSRRSEFWKVLFERIRDALLLATDELIDGLRGRMDRDTSLPLLSVASMSALG